MTPESAEICKLAVNCYITSKIAFANLIGDVADRTAGANKMDILRAVGADSRIGPKCMLPGWGFGGPCLPRDNRALALHVEKVGLQPTTLRASDQANREHLDAQVDDFKAKVPKQLIHLRGVAYKERCAVPIIEESQFLAFGERLAREGYAVVVEDTAAIIEEVQKKYGSLFTYKTV
jgi:UDP-glucose 6-dehydrogenase